MPLVRSNAQVTQTTYPPDPCLVHPLPPAPQFEGREAELAQLRSWWAVGAPSVVALVGLGGAGKTALASRFLAELSGPGGGPRPAGLFVWSFYQQPDAGLFLQEAYRYFSGGADTPALAKGAGLLHLLREALHWGGPYLLVLDGLERVQRQADSSAGAFGQIEDPLLKGLLTRIAEGMGQTVALITSRFPLTDLDPFRGQGYRHLEVGGLDLPAAVALLRKRGVKGDDLTLAALVETYGAHALTLDHLGGLIGQFLDGDPRRAPEAPPLATPGSDHQALRLARLLNAYEAHLPPTELALLGRLCLLSRSVSEEHILRLFLCSPVVGTRALRECADQIARLPIRTSRPFERRRELAEAVRTTLQERLCDSPVAGPEAAFRQNLLLALEEVVELHRINVEDDVDELLGVYTDTGVDICTDARPLPVMDRERLRSWAKRYLELRDHPLLPFQKPHEELELAFQNLGWSKAARRRSDLSPDDVLMEFRLVRERLHGLALEHFVLRRVRELCRLYQQKWSTAGPLAALDERAMRQVLGALVGRHLVLREADGSLSVHPAIRDHFARMAQGQGQASWHDLIREQLVSLVHRPGVRLPEDRATLDLVEEAIDHALQAGRSDQACWLYHQVLGGLRHLAWRLGEVARGLRILRRFDPCPDHSGLAWCLRSLGELDEAYTHNSMPYFRADIRLLQGRLPLVAAEGDGARAATAAFLMGQTAALPPDLLGMVIPRAQVLLYLGRLNDAWRATPPEGLYQEIGWEGERVRGQLLMAEVARRQRDEAACRKLLETASRWILHSGSVEHLCLWHLMRSRLAIDLGDSENAGRALDEGLHMARQAGLVLISVELLCEQAALFLARGNAVAASAPAREALRMACAENCQFVWGAAQAGHLLGESRARQNMPEQARARLARTLALRERIGDPRAEETRRLLEGLRG
jgi:hypothetical protein